MSKTELTIQRLMQFADRHDAVNECIEVSLNGGSINISYYYGLDDEDFEEEDFESWCELKQFGSDASIYFETVEKLKAFISLYE